MARPIRLPARFTQIDANSLLHGGLLALLLVVYVSAVYVLVVAAAVYGAGGTFTPDTATPWWLNGLAFALIAATFVPVARVLHRRTADLVYAEHDNPYAVVSRMTQPLEIMADPAAGLPLLAAAIAAELRLPYVAIEGPQADAPLHAAHGSVPARAHLVRLPINHHGESLGALTVSARGAGRPLTPSDRDLLHDVARRLGVVFHNLTLSAGLQEARERLVIAREEERRRIRNDLHDGLAPTLASLQMQLGAARTLIRSDPAQAETLVEEMRGDLRAATASIRQLVYDLRPPLLDELGLVGAIRSMRLADATLRVEVFAPDPMPRLPAAVEVAAYRIAAEAVRNVVRHAGATCCAVALALEGGMLAVRVEDDGRGVESDERPGVGLLSMRERAAELGGSLEIGPGPAGGTRLVARLPLGN